MYTILNMKLNEFDLYIKLCSVNDEEFFDDWNECIKEYSLQLPFFYNNKDLLLYIQESEIVYHKTEESTSGMLNTKCTIQKDIYCFKLNKTLFIYVYVEFVRPQDMSSSYTEYQIYFDNKFTENYL